MAGIETASLTGGAIVRRAAPCRGTIGVLALGGAGGRTSVQESDSWAVAADHDPVGVCGAVTTTAEGAGAATAEPHSPNRCPATMAAANAKRPPASTQALLDRFAPFVTTSRLGAPSCRPSASG